MNAIASRHAWRKLAGPSGDGLNPYLNADGAFIGDGAPLLEKTADGRFAVRAPEVLEVLLRIGYGGPVEMSGPLRSLSHVAKCLNAGDVGQAHVALAIAGFAPLASTAHARAMREADALGKSWESEPRDYHGRWMSFLSDDGEGGGGGGGASSPPKRLSSSLKIKRERALTYDEVMDKYIRPANSAGVKDSILAAIAWKESRFDPDAKAKGSTGKGLFQVTAQTLGDINKVYHKNYTMDDMTDPAKNAEVGALVVKRKLGRNPNDLDGALRRYLGQTGFGLYLGKNANKYAYKDAKGQVRLDKKSALRDYNALPASSQASYVAQAAAQNKDYADVVQRAANAADANPNDPMAGLISVIAP